MRISVVGKDKARNRALAAKFLENGFETGRKDPEMIICQGGDGTFLYNERKYPGIPKLLLRGKSICRLCRHISWKELIRRIKSGKYKIKEFSKLEAVLGKRKLYCANDFVIRNRHPARALRFTVIVNGKRIGGTHIGDGVVVSTAFGSTGYFRSITRSSFRKGIGLAFNNTVDKVNHMVLPENSVITIRADRDAAHFSYDNEHRLHPIRMGERVKIRKSKEKFRIVQIQGSS